MVLACVNLQQIQGCKDIHFPACSNPHLTAYFCLTTASFLPFLHFSQQVVLAVFHKALANIQLRQSDVLQLLAKKTVTQDHHMPAFLPLHIY